MRMCLSSSHEMDPRIASRFEVLSRPQLHYANTRAKKLIEFAVQVLTLFSLEIESLSTSFCEGFASSCLHISRGVSHRIVPPVPAGAVPPRSTVWRSVPLAIPETGAKLETLSAEHARYCASRTTGTLARQRFLLASDSLLAPLPIFSAAYPGKQMKCNLNYQSS